jgi:hypothetical protein
MFQVPASTGLAAGNQYQEKTSRATRKDRKLVITITPVL